MAYLCPYGSVSDYCLAACAPQSGANVSLCLNSCHFTENSNSSLVRALAPCQSYTPSVVVDTVYIEVPADGSSGDFYQDAESAFLAFLPVFVSILCVYVVVRVLSFILR
jgi:hypothetical protein